jgi:hypothetical protein
MLLPHRREETAQWTTIGVRKDLLITQSSGVHNSLHSQTCHRPHLGPTHKLQLEQLPEYTSVSTMVKLQSRPTGFRPQTFRCRQDPLLRILHQCHNAYVAPKIRRYIGLIGEIAATVENGAIVRAPTPAASHTLPSLCSLDRCFALHTCFVSICPLDLTVDYIKGYPGSDYHPRCANFYCVIG